MIRVTKVNIPEILQEKQLEWTTNLLRLVQEFSHYENIPKKEKLAAIEYYKHEDIKVAVVESTNGKCVYCESYIENTDYTNIEHFYPKSIYPKFTFKWSNLFPSCRKCNIPKGEIDTKNVIIVHPSNDDGEDYFAFRDLRIVVSNNAPDKIKARNTINTCDLTRVSLCRKHAEVLLGFLQVEQNLGEKIEDYNRLSQNAAKLRLANRLKEAVDNLKDQSQYDKPFAGFLRYHLRNSDCVKATVSIINNHVFDLQIEPRYEFGWSFY